MPRTGTTRPLRNSVRERRQALDLSAEKLAQRCNVSRQTIVNLEGRISNPSVHLALRVANQLGASVEELFTLKESPQ